MELQAIQQALGTVVVIPVTPFTPQGAVDYPAYRRIIQRLVAGGVRVITPNGNASEFYSLTLDEVRRVLEATVEAAEGQALVMAGVGHDTVTGGALARHAQQAGAAAMMIHQPVHPFRSPEGWVAYHRAIAEAAPEMGVVPYIRDAAINAAALTALLAACPTVVGAKYAVNDPLLFSTLVADVGAARLAWVCGIAELWAPSFWPGGAVGFTSGLANVHPALPFEMLHALNAGDRAAGQAAWAQARPFEAMRARRSSGANVSVIKEALAQLGVCDRTVRPPISELPDSERAEVAAILAGWGLAAQ